MSKSITITQGNIGICILNTYKNSNNTVQNLNGYGCNVDVVFPDNTTKRIEIPVIDEPNGIALLSLDEELTKQLGLHKLYFNLYKTGVFVTSSDVISYYVIDDKGGV